MTGNDYFSVRKLKIGGLEIRVRYKTGPVGDVFSTINKAQLSPSSTTATSTRPVSRNDIQSYDEDPREGSREGTLKRLNEPSQLEGEPTRTTVPGASGQTKSRHFPAVAERGRRRKAILELGAGTGICGMAACSTLGWPVIMTDREDDVIGNLKNNVALNGMEYSARVVRLEWGEGRGGGVEKGLPAEVEEQKPFQVILASDTLYPGKPLSDSQDFFEMVKDLLDPTEGVLLMAYTPRPPSLQTENMLRCAYRAGLSGKRLHGGWNTACSRDGGDAAIHSSRSGVCPVGKERLVHCLESSCVSVCGGSDSTSGCASIKRKPTYSLAAASCCRENGGGGGDGACGVYTSGSSRRGSCNTSDCASIKQEPTHGLEEHWCRSEDSCGGGSHIVRGVFTSGNSRRGSCNTSDCTSIKQEPTHGLEGDCCRSEDDCGGDSHIVRGVFTGGNNWKGSRNNDYASIKQEPTHVLEELCCCDEDGGGGVGSESACGVHMPCEHCRKLRARKVFLRKGGGEDSDMNTTALGGNASGNAARRPKRCTPVLLAFSLSPQAAFGGKAPHTGDGYQSPCEEEQMLLSQWKDVFPDLNYRNTTSTPIVSPHDQGSPCLRQEPQGFAREAFSGAGERAHVVDDVTWECLWGVDNECPSLQPSPTPMSTSSYSQTSESSRLLR